MGGIESTPEVVVDGADGPAAPGASEITLTVIRYDGGMSETLRVLAPVKDGPAGTRSTVNELEVSRLVTFMRTGCALHLDATIRGYNTDTISTFARLFRALGGTKNNKTAIIAHAAVVLDLGDGDTGHMEEAIFASLRSVLKAMRCAIRLPESGGPPHPYVKRLVEGSNAVGVVRLSDTFTRDINRAVYAAHVATVAAHRYLDEPSDRDEGAWGKILPPHADEKGTIPVVLSTHTAEGPKMRIFQLAYTMENNKPTTAWSILDPGYDEPREGAAYLLPDPDEHIFRALAAVVGEPAPASLFDE